MIFKDNYLHVKPLVWVKGLYFGINLVPFLVILGNYKLRYNQF